jgi:ferric-dicitrate binding protein FerR (iron transport regulator)
MTSVPSQGALQRLEASRALLQAELRQFQPAQDSPAAAGSSAPAWSTAMPAFDTAWRALRLWWRRHPARPVVDIAADAGEQALVPLVRRHPLASVGLAMAAGAAMVVWRPWRSRVTAAVWAGLGAQLTAGLVKSILHPGTLSALLGGLARGPSSNPPTPPPSS